MLRATETLARMGGTARNRYAVAQRYRTTNGHASTQYAYRALNRAIARGEILQFPNGAVMVAPAFWSLSEIRRANELAGLYFFSPDTLRFFRSRVSDRIHRGPGGIFLVTSEQAPDSPRRWTVRRFHPETASVDTVGAFEAYGNAAEAHRVARELAEG